jgi:thioredoxin reductase
LAFPTSALATFMSRYLIERSEQAPWIHVLDRTEVTALLGDGALEGVALHRNADGTTSALAVGGPFVFIGATPSTECLQGQLSMGRAIGVRPPPGERDRTGAWGRTCTVNHPAYVE